MSGKFAAWVLLIGCWLFGLVDRLVNWFLSGFDWIAFVQLATWSCMFGLTYFLNPGDGV